MNRGEIRTAILDDLSKDSNDTFHTTAVLNRYIDRAVQFTAKYKPWEQTQKAYKIEFTPTGNEEDEYFDYPQNYISDSMYRLAIGDGSIASDVKYKPLVWEEYLDHKEKHAPDTTKVWSDHRRQYFIYPILTSPCTISIWGHEAPAAMTDDADKHPFTDDANIEDAILRLTKALCYEKRLGSYINEARSLRNEAIAILNEAFKVQRRNQSIKKTHEADMWKHINFISLSGNGPTQYGNFNTY